MSKLKNLISFILLIESRLILRKYKPFIIAVTGSVGKTSTKDAIFCVIKNHFAFARKSEKSMNSEIGLPLTIIGAPNAWRSVSGWVKNIWHGIVIIFTQNEYPKCLVLEVGADHPNDIKKVAKWLKPDISVITRVSRTPVHVEFFHSPEQVLAEKASLAYAVKDGGSLVLFADDDNVASLGDKVKQNNKSNINVFKFGLTDTADIKGLNYSANINDLSNMGISFEINCGGHSHNIAVKNILGRNYLYTFLAAMAVGQSLKMNSDKILSGLKDYEAPRGRMNIIKGINDSILIDDSYNSSPDATLSALETLKDLSISGRKIAVLGDMMELGKYSTQEHKNIGSIVSSIANILITIGPRSIATADEAMRGGLAKENVHSFDSAHEAGEYLASIVQANDLVLIKGSQSMRMEKVTKMLLLEPEKADRLLVRQEPEWLLR